MTKKEIYERVVELTAELEKTNVAEKLFETAMDGDELSSQVIIDLFPVFHPELYQKIVIFGKEFNELVGNSDEDNAQREDILKRGESLMYYLASTKIIPQIIETSEKGEIEKLKEILNNFNQEYSDLLANIRVYQEDYNKFMDDHRTGHEGAIFGTEADEENGIFVFDPSIIDPLSFYLLIILAKISDVYFFADDEECNNPSADIFYDAIADATNEAFAEFVASYNIVDCVGEDEEYQTVGEILVAALADEFEEYVEEDEEETV